MQKEIKQMRSAHSDQLLPRRRRTESKERSQIKIHDKAKHIPYTLTLTAPFKT